MRFVRGYGVLRDCECGFFSANLAEDVQLAATLTPDRPVQLIIDFVTPKINPFLSHLLSLSLSHLLVRSSRLSSLRSRSELPSAVVSRSRAFVRHRLTARCVLQCGSIVTVTDAAVGPSLFHTRGLTGYTFERAELGRCPIVSDCQIVTLV
jgi:hypothetical protein